MITIIPIESVSKAHDTLIIEAFNKRFIDKGGQQDGYIVLVGGRMLSLKKRILVRVRGDR